MKRLHSEARGNGPPLLCLHGWGMNLRVFDGLAAALATQFEVICIDLPGHGQSPELPAGEWLDAVARCVEAATTAGGNTPVLLGWSLGGQFALQLAIERQWPLVLLSSTPRFVTAPDWPHGLGHATVAQFAAHLHSDPQRTLLDFLELQVRGTQGAQQTLRLLQGALLQHGEASPQALQTGMDRLQQMDLREPSRKLHSPVLLVSGGRDRITPPAAARWLAETLPAATLLEIPRAAHAPFLSHPTEVVSAIRAWSA